MKQTMKVRTLEPPVDFSRLLPLLRVLMSPREVPRMIAEDSDEARLSAIHGSYSPDADVVRVLDVNETATSVSAADTIAGFTRYKQLPGPDETGRSVVHLMEIVVIPSFQGKGLGRLLMNDAIARSRESGFDVLMSRTFLDNDASIALHRSTGFSIAFTRDESIIWRMEFVKTSPHDC